MPPKNSCCKKKILAARKIFVFSLYQENIFLASESISVRTLLSIGRKLNNRLGWCLNSVGCPKTMLSVIGSGSKLIGIRPIRL